MLNKFLARIFGSKKEVVQEQEYLIIFKYRYGMGETYATETKLAKMKRKWPEFIVLDRTPVYSAPPDATFEDLFRIQNQHLS